MVMPGFYHKFACTENTFLVVDLKWYCVTILLYDVLKIDFEEFDGNIIFLQFHPFYIRFYIEISFIVVIFLNVKAKSVGGNYCVIFYVGHFPTPLFGLIYIQSLLCTLVFLVLTPNYFLPSANVCCRARGARMRGRRAWVAWVAYKGFGFIRKIILAHNLMFQPGA